LLPKNLLIDKTKDESRMVEETKTMNAERSALRRIFSEKPEKSQQRREARLRFEKGEKLTRELLARNGSETHKRKGGGR